MAPNKLQYIAESVERSLDVHKRAGRVREWRHGPEDRKPSYIVELYRYGTFVGSLAETKALVVGLRVGSLVPDAEQ